MALQHLRSSTAHKRPIPTVMSAGQIAINTNEASPALFFKDSNGDLVKVGPVHIGPDAPNSSPASVAATALVTGTVYQILTVGTSDFTLVGASANTVGTIFTATGTTTGTGTVSGQQGVEKGEQWLDNSGGTYVLKIYDGTAWRSESGTFVDVSGDTMTGALLLDNAASASAPDLSFDGDADTGVYSPGANRVAVATNGTGRLFVDPIGRIGIDTNIPDVLLHLGTTPSSTGSAGIIGFGDVANHRVAEIEGFREGSSFAGSLIFKTHQSSGTSSSNGEERVRITSAGFVGIGKNNPTMLLDVNGDALINSVIVGRSGGNIASNLAVGGPVFSSNTTGNQNTVLGNASMRYSTIGSSNTAVGFNALNDNTEGSLNTAVGIKALNSNTLGRLNTGVGRNALYSNTAGDNNTAIGRDALYSATGDRNTAVGQNAGYYIQGSNNTILGAYQGTSADATLNDTVIISAGQTERLRIDSTGLVGVGTSSPGANIHLANNASPAIYIQSTSAATNSFGELRFGNGTGNTSALSSLKSYRLAASNASTALAFETTNSSGTKSEAMRIDSSGRLLVGTPTSITNSNPYTNQKTIELVDTGTVRSILGRDDSTVSGGVNIGAIDWYGNGGDGTTWEKVASIMAEADGTHATGDKPSRLVFSTTASGASAPTERLRIDSTGLVKMYGQVTVNNISPFFSSSLTVNSNIAVRSLDAATSANIHLVSSSNHGVAEIRANGNNATGYLAFSTRKSGSSYERVRIDEDGNVLVGGTTTSSTNAAYISQNGVYVSNRTTGASDLWNGKLNGAVTSTINADGSCTFAGSVSIGGTDAAHTIDEYEEGTFTVGMTIGGTAIVLTTDQGTYTKVGDLCQVQINIVIPPSSVTTETGNLVLTGLPFASPNTTRSNMSTAVCHITNWATDFRSGDKTILVINSANSTSLNLVAGSRTTGLLDETALSFTAGTCKLSTTFTYRIV